jgi:hypothetical protein
LPPKGRGANGWPARAIRRLSGRRNSITTASHRSAAASCCGRPTTSRSWLRGTGLRPFLARLDEAEQRLFLDRYAALLAEAFPTRSDGKVLLPYPRLFFIATPQAGR